jgi:hypothetical protein
MLNDAFRFLHRDLQDKLIRLVRAMGLDYEVEDGHVRTRDDDWAVVEDLRCAVRSSVFSEWQTWRGQAGLDSETRARYRVFMEEKGIRYLEEEENGTHWFVLSLQEDPAAWGVEAPPAPKGRKKKA